jgi:hypothetical protein
VSRAAAAGAAGVVLAMLAAAGSASAGPGYTLRGTVVLGPTCSGPDLEGPGCSQPWVDVPLLLHDATGTRVVARQRSGAGGEFGFTLPAGRYRLSAQTDKVTRCPVLDVDLPAMDGRALRLDCDSGRR